MQPLKTLQISKTNTTGGSIANSLFLSNNLKVEQKISICCNNIDVKQKTGNIQRL